MNEISAGFLCAEGQVNQGKVTENIYFFFWFFDKHVYQITTARIKTLPYSSDNFTNLFFKISYYTSMSLHYQKRYLH